MKNMKAMMLSVSVLFFGSVALATTVYVATPENGGSDATGDGSAGAPYETVYKGMEELQKIDETGTLSLGEGTFFVTNNTVTSGAGLVVDKGVRLRGAGIEKTILSLDPAATQGRVLIVNHKDAVVSSLTVTGGKSFASRWTVGSALRVNSAGGTVSNVCVRGNNFAHICHNGGAVYLNGANALLTHSVVTNNGFSTPNSVGSYAGGVYMDGGRMENCLVADNRSICGGGICVSGAAKVYNCTIAFNHAVRNSESVGKWGGIYPRNYQFKAINTLFCGNRADSATGTVGGEEYEMPTSAADIRNFTNCFQNCAFGNANGVQPIGAGAKFVTVSCLKDPAAGDYTLVRGSATIDGGVVYAGIAARDLALNDRIIGVAPDIGCYEYDTTTFACGIDVSAVSVFSGEEVVFTAVVYGTNADETVTYDWTVSDSGGRTLFTSDLPSFALPMEDADMITVALSVTGDGDHRSSDIKRDFITVRPTDMFVVEGECPNSRAPYEDWAHAATNLNDLLAYAVGGQTIHIGEGTFYGPQNTKDGAFVVDKSITVVGAGPEKTILALDPAATQGRVLCVANSAAMVSGVTITGGKGFSERWFAGSGVIIDAAGGIISNAVIRGNNFAHICQNGGAVSLNGAKAVLTHSVITNNGYTTPSSTGRYACGVYMTGGCLENCLVADNRGICGGGVRVSDNAKVRNCTIARNHAIVNTESAAKWGGIYNYNGNTAFSVVNTIFYDNRADSATGTVGGEEYEMPTSAADIRNFTNCFQNCAFGNANGVQPIGAGAKAVTGAAFADAEGGDFSLVRGTAAIESGKFYDGLAAVDLAGNDRVIGLVPDIGCYEFDVNQFACGIDVSSGTVFLGEGVTFSATVYGDVGEVSYSWTLTDGAGKVLVTSDEASFVFAGAAAGPVAARLTVTDENGIETSDVRENAVVVLPPVMYAVAGENPNSRAPYEDWTHAATNLAELIEYARGGQTLQLGEGTFVGAENTSGASFVLRKSLTVVGAGVDKTILTLDPAATYGRVLYLTHQDATVSNLTVSAGKGLKWWYNDAGSTVRIDAGTLTRSRVTDAQPTVLQSSGGAVYLKGGTARLIACTVDGNNWKSTTQDYGGVFVDGGCVYDCLIISNKACFTGGGLGANGAAKVSNCTVVSNEAGRTSGAICVKGSSALVANCLFAGNVALQATGSAGGQEYEIPEKEADVIAFTNRFRNCGFAAAAALGNGSVSVPDFDAIRFTDPAAGDFALDFRSPFYKKGLYQDWMDGAKDFVGNDRLVKQRRHVWLVDMGAYESPWVGPGFMLLLR